MVTMFPAQGGTEAQARYGQASFAACMCASSAVAGSAPPATNGNARMGTECAEGASAQFPEMHRD
jgi:hypothetical protein